MKIVYHPACLKYHEPGHPESPARVAESYNFLQEKNFEFIKSVSASRDDLLLVHTKRLIEEVKNEEITDLDTPNLKKIFDYALCSVGGAIKAMEIALNNERSFSLMRPPGHHAGKDFCAGFCYFNNIAVAVAKALEKVTPNHVGFGVTLRPVWRRVKRAAILDIDCHHGNGTENIFLGKNNVLYVSLHQSLLYPGTGLKSQFNCLNFPLPAGTDEKKYFETLNLALAKISQFKPELLAVSAGFDTYKEDPLTYFALEIESYQKIGQKIAALNLPTFAVLEGGYSYDLPQCIYNFLLGLEKND